MKAMHRPEVRKRHMDALHHSEWIKVKTDKGQLELLEKWNLLGFHFEPNYPVKTETDLFYVDGYDKEKNIVLEYDGKYHKRPTQQEKDLIRQNKIIGTLNPKRFWRYDAVNKTVINALKGYDDER
jgi:very-short-patch-repair endonuclease